jgi:hypothetical protein
MYKQNLYKIIEPVRINTIKRLNKSKKWKYGYDTEHDIIVISKTGQIGEIYEIQNLKIALPKQSNVYKRSNNKKEQYWDRFEYPKSLKNVKTIFDWRDYPNEHKDKWFDYIDEEFDRRENGFWFNNNGVPTYITGTHYMYLQWSKIDVGAPEFRDAKKMFTDKVVPISVNYPFFFKPIQDGMDRPKSELAYRVPAQKFTRKKLQTNEQLEEIVGLDTTIDWKNTGDNSYDGEKLNLLVHDESGKWDRPDNILNNWRVTKTCLRLGSRIIGKCMMGSTSNSLDKGGDNFKKLYRDSNVTKRNKNGQTKSGLYSLFIPMEWNYEGFMDRYGIPLFNTPENPVQDMHGDYIDIGVIDHWENEVEGLKKDQDALNEFYRQFPRTEEHAFRDETQNSIFNLAKIYEQIDFNDDVNNPGISKGNFQWVNGVKDSKVIFYPDPKGRFNISWTPDPHLQNNIIIKNGIKHPGNEHMGAFGCDSYDISGTVDGQGSKGSLHGLTKFSMENTPPSMFFLEYIARPATSEIFFEDMLMALVFYGMPLLAENNKPRLLYYLRRRGYRGYSMNRPDKVWNKLSTTEKEIGGIPNSSEDIKQAHAAAIEMYIQNYVGLKQDNTYGDIYFNKTLNDWAKFDINKRTKFDATISSGLAIMACNRHLYAPNVKIKKEKVNINIKRYNNHGVSSKLIK